MQTAPVAKPACFFTHIDDSGFRVIRLLLIKMHSGSVLLNGYAIVSQIIVPQLAESFNGYC